MADKSEQLFYEKSSYDKVAYELTLNGHKIKLESDYKTNTNSILIDGKEYSQNRRGLNTTKFNKKLDRVEYAFV